MTAARDPDKYNLNGKCGGCGEFWCQCPDAPAASEHDWLDDLFSSHTDEEIAAELERRSVRMSAFDADGRSRIKVLEVALSRAIEVIEWCGLNDKTPTYEYGEGEGAQRRDGSIPGPGKAFNTPREFASWWPERLRDVLNAGKLDV